jgi:hypothetical protein
MEGVALDLASTLHSSTLMLIWLMQQQIWLIDFLPRLWASAIMRYPRWLENEGMAQDRDRAGVAHKAYAQS